VADTFVMPLAPDNSVFASVVALLVVVITSGFGHRRRRKGHGEGSRGDNRREGRARQQPHH
jgi:hypothetical protein